MELVYLWVEDYKNIKNQGFNFSSQFHCEYDEDKNELTIEENQNHIPNFFGKNINITAIVGKNGSGKSSIFEFLSYILNCHLICKYNYFYIMKDKDKIFYHSNTKKTNTSDEENNEENNKIELSKINNIEFKKNKELSKYIDMYYLNISHLERNNIIKNDAPSIDDQINYLGVYAKDDIDRNRPIYPVFSEFNLSQFDFFQTYETSQLLLNEKHKEALLSSLKIKEPFYLEIKYYKDDIDKTKKHNFPDTEDIDKLLNFLKEIKENLIKINSDKLSSFFKLIYNAENNLESKFHLEFKK